MSKIGEFFRGGFGINKNFRKNFDRVDIDGDKDSEVVSRIFRKVRADLGEDKVKQICSKKTHDDFDVAYEAMWNGGVRERVIMELQMLGYPVVEGAPVDHYNSVDKGNKFLARIESSLYEDLKYHNERLNGITGM